MRKNLLYKLYYIGFCTKQIATHTTGVSKRKEKRKFDTRILVMKLENGRAVVSYFILKSDLSLNLPDSSLKHEHSCDLIRTVTIRNEISPVGIVCRLR